MRRDGFGYMDLDDFEELLADKPAHERWELIGGRVVRMMVGARWEHHVVIRNVALEIQQRLRARGQSCQVLTETFWLKERFMDLAVFPDVMVRCGPRLPPEASSINDPLVLVEVVSPGSEMRDRVEKDRLYRRLPSLMLYVLIDRDTPRIDVLDRDERSWSLRTAEGLDAELDLPALGMSMPLADLYRDVLGA